MSRYELFKFLHIVGSITWVGGGLGLLVLFRSLVAAGDHATLALLGERSKSLGNYLFVPAFALTLSFGVAMVATESSLAFSDLWILIGFGGILLSGIAEMTIAQPAAKRFAEAFAAHGQGSPEASAAAARLSLGNIVGVAVLLIVVLAMVVKPTIS